jgi:predicted secreted hydrolase
MSSRLLRALAGPAIAAALTAGVVAAGRADEPVWRLAAPGRVLSLPADHASHPDYKIEWWYYTGNLHTAGGRRFGYQLTFFRVGIDPRPANPSRWTVRDLHMAHFAVADIDQRRFHFFDRLQREAGGWAGAATDRLRVWNGRWSIEDQPDGSQRLAAAQDGVRVELTLGSTAAWRGGLAGDRRWVTHGRDGYSRKGSEPGNASHYYSMTRLDTRGTVTIDGAPHVVTGLSWMDHEFGTSMLEPAQAGWDWFALHLSDGRDLMLYQMRRTDGVRDPHSSGTLVSPDGRITRLAAGDYRLEPRAHWTSSSTRVRYPIRWRVSVPGERLDLDVGAVLPQQELHTPASTGVIYWEGAVDVSGSAAGRRITGMGYMELTGYSGVPLSESFR